MARFIYARNRGGCGLNTTTNIVPAFEAVAEGRSLLSPTSSSRRRGPIARMRRVKLDVVADGNVLIALKLLFAALWVPAASRGRCGFRFSKGLHRDS